MNEIEFLKARLDELERDFEGHDFDYTARDSGTSICRHTSHVSGWSSTCPRATHSALIRAQIAAQRSIIADAERLTKFDQDMLAQEGSPDPGPPYLGTCFISALLQQFAGHPGFEEAWKA